MTTLVLGTVGSIVGGMVGGPIGAQVGWLAGSLLGNLVDPPKIEGPRRSDLKLQVAEYGKPIPFVWGTGRIAGNVIDQTDLQEHKQKSGGKGGPEVTSYTYSASFAIALAAAKHFGEGAIRGIQRIWADGRLIWDAANGEPMPCTLYLGTEDQDPDPTFEAIHGVGEVPAYRGIAYVVFTDYMLTDFGDRIPLLEFEVYTGSGTYPWRVSAFTPGVAGAGVEGVTYDSGRITVASYGPGSTYYERVFDLQGVEDTGLAYSSTLDLSSVFIYPMANLAAAASEAGWYVRNTFTTAFTANPGGGPISGAAAGQGAIYKRDNIYAIGANGISQHVFVARWPATAGVISAETGTSDAIHDFGNCNNQISSFEIGSSNNDFLYVIDFYHSPLTLNEFDLDLTLIRSWDLDAEYAVSNIVNGYGFTVYQQAGGPLVFAVDRGLAGAKQAFCFTLNSDLTVTQVAGVGSDPSGSAAMGPIIELGTTGYAITNDGVICLDPPSAMVPLSQIVADLSDMTQVGSYDVSELTDLVRWFAVGNQMTVRNAIETLRAGFMFDAVESDDSIKFRKRGATDSILTIPDDDLDVRGEGEPPGTPLQTVRKREQGMPRNVTLRYIDVEMDYQTGAQNSPRLTTRSDSDVTLDLAIGFTAAEAAQKCWSLQVAEWIERETFSWSTSRQYSWVEPCDVVTVRGRVVRVTNRTEAPNGVIRWEGVQHRPSIYTQPATGAPSEGWTPQEPPGPKVATTAILLDLPLLSDGHYQNGHYVAMYPAALGSWSGAALYKSADGGTNYAGVAEALVPAVVGTVAVGLAAFAGGNEFDEANVIRVTLADTTAELTSASTDGVLNGANVCALGTAATGWEVFQFRTATLISPGVYDLSGLLRGRYGTEWRMDTHAASETFIDLSTVVNVDAPSAETGLSRKFKPVSFGGTLASATAQDFTNTGVARKPFAPVLLGGGRDGSSNATFSWTPRRRGTGGWPNGVDLPATEPDNWQVEIATSSAYTTIVRTTLVTVPTISYTAAQQTTDFGSPQATIYWRVAQVGGAGLGYYAKATT